MQDILAALLYYLFSEDKKAHPIPPKTVNKLNWAIKKQLPATDSEKRTDPGLHPDSLAAIMGTESIDEP